MQVARDGNLESEGAVEGADMDVCDRNGKTCSSRLRLSEISESLFFLQ